MNTLIVISAQTLENVSDTNLPCWKPKGEQTFNLWADSHNFFYGEESCVKAIKTLLERQSNSKFKFEYRDHEVIFHKPIVLNSDEFEAELENVLTKK